jgi:hypothetical protein
VTPLFTINFRREAYLKEVARARRRVIALGLWVTYFGVLTVVLGLYGLNCVAMSRRVNQIERQALALRQAQGSQQPWRVSQTELVQVERYVENPRLWRDRLGRLAAMQPPNVRLTSIAVNPQNLSNAQDQNKLVVTGELRGIPGQEKMRGVMQFVNELHADSVFAVGYRNIRLASSRTIEEGAGVTEFVIECR